MSKEQAAASSEAGVLIGAAQAEYETDIGNIVIDPRELVLEKTSRWAAKLKYPSLGREREAAAVLIGYKKSFVELIQRRQWDAIDRLIGEVQKKIAALTTPEKKIGIIEQLSRFHKGLAALSWTVEEIEALKWFRTTDEDEASEASISSIKIGDSLVTRRQVRERLRGSVSNARLRECERREDEALKLERENSCRRERNELTVHRQWS
jgi:hypothetical protein